MRLGDYADGAWMFIATCDTCGRQARLYRAEALTHPRMGLAALAIRLRRRACRHRTARIDAVRRIWRARRKVTFPASLWLDRRRSPSAQR